MRNEKIGNRIESKKSKNDTPTDDPRLEAMLRNALAMIEAAADEQWPCLLCDRLTLGKQLFISQSDRPGKDAFSPPKAGKTRVVAVPYGLCDRHPVPLTEADRRMVADRLAYLMRSRGAMMN